MRCPTTQKMEKTSRGLYCGSLSYFVAGAQAFKHFKLQDKCRNGSGSPWVKWIAHCPRCNINQGLDREGHPEGPPDNRTLQTFLDKHRHHDAEFAHMTPKSLTFRVPLHDRMLFELRSAVNDNMPEEGDIVPDEDLYADATASPHRMCSSTPQMESSQLQSFIAGQATRVRAEPAACTQSLNTSSPALPLSGPGLVCATSAESEVHISDEPGQQHAKSACLPRVNCITNYFQPVRASTGTAASCATIPTLVGPQRSVDLEASVLEAGAVGGARHSKPSSLHLSNKLDKSFSTASAIASRPPAATVQASTLLEQNPSGSRAVGACVCADATTNTLQHDSAEATDMSVIDLVCNEQLDSNKTTNTASASHPPIGQHHTICHSPPPPTSREGPETHPLTFADNLLLTQLGPDLAVQPPLPGNVSAATLAALLSSAATEAGIIASCSSASAAATTLAPTQKASVPAAVRASADGKSATASGSATVEAANPAGAGASGEPMPKEDTVCTAELASVPLLGGATAAALLSGRARQARNEADRLGPFSWDGRSEEHPPNPDKFQTTCVKRQSAPPPRYIAEPDRPQHAHRASSGGERRIRDQEACQGPAKPSARTAAGGSAGAPNPNLACHEQHGGTGAEVDMEQSASLPAGATAAAPLSGKSRPAGNEAERLGPFSWDKMSREYPPNPDQFQPARLKRQSEPPPRFITESSQPQHAHRTNSHSKRQKLDQQACKHPAGHTQHDHVSNGLSGLSSGHSEAYKPKTTADSDSASPQAASDQQALPSDRARADGRPGLAAFADGTQSSKFAAQDHACPMPSAPQKAAQPVAASSMCNVSHVKEENVGINRTRTRMAYAATPALQPSTLSPDMHSNRYAAELAKRCGAVTSCISCVQCPALDHTVYDHQECCSGVCDFNVDALKPGLSAALLPLELRKSKLKGQFRWGATYPVKENRFGSRGDYKRCLDFQKTQFAAGAQIVLPGIKDVLEAVAYSSAFQQQTQRAKHWARQEGFSTSGQFTLWHEQKGYSRLHKEIISSMIFHLKETPSQSSVAQSQHDDAGASLPMHAVVEVMFVATKLEHRKKKFFVQLLRLFMREYLLKHYQEVDLLVMATPQATIEWGDAKLSRQLGTDAFTLLDEQHRLVVGRTKCTDCNWLHIAINQSLLQASVCS